MKRLAISLFITLTMFILGLIVAHLIHLHYCPDIMYTYYVLLNEFFNEPKMLINQLMHVMFVIPTENLWIKYLGSKGYNYFDYASKLNLNFNICMLMYIFIYFIWFRTMYCLVKIIINLFKHLTK